MISKKNNFSTSGLLQFSPYVIFLAIFSSIYIYYNIYTKNITEISPIIIAGVALFAAITAVTYSFFTFKKDINLEKKIEIFLSGIAHINTLTLSFTLFNLSMLHHMISKINGIVTMVTCCLLYIPTTWIMPILFIINSIISIILASLPTTIILCMPIAYGVAQSLQIPLGFMIATILSGALFGHHLLLCFDDLIESSEQILSKSILSRQKTDWIIIIAGIITIVLLSQSSYQELHPNLYKQLQLSCSYHTYITVIPYLFLLIARFCRIDLLVSIMITSWISLYIMIFYHQVSLLYAITTMAAGFFTQPIIFHILFLNLIMTGLIKIIKFNHGFYYMINKLGLYKSTKNDPIEYKIVILTIIKSMLTIIETKYFNTLHAIIKKITHQSTTTYNAMMTLSDIISTIIQSMLPFSIMMLWPTCTIPCSYLEIICYMIYPIMLLLCIIISTIYTTHQSIYKQIQQ